MSNERNNINLQDKILKAEELLLLTQIIQDSEYNNWEGQKLLNKITYLNTFARELCHCLNKNDPWQCYTTSDDLIEADFSAVYGFVNELCGLLDKRL